MNVRSDLQRDNIIFRYVCAGGIIYDSSMHRYVFDYRTDNMVYRRIEEECQSARLEFGNSTFNEFIASIRGYNPDCGLSWDRSLPGNLLLPGEVLCLNAGCPDEIQLLKVASGKYIAVSATDTSKVLQPLCTDGTEVFEIGNSVDIDILPGFKVQWIHLLPPARINRAADYAMSKTYHKAKVVPDISEFVQETQRSLHEGCFIERYQQLVKTYHANGISSFALRKLSDAFLIRYPHL